MTEKELNKGFFPIIENILAIIENIYIIKN